MDKTDKVFLIGFGMLILFVYLIVTMPDTTKCHPLTIGDNINCRIMTSSEFLEKMATSTPPEWVDWNGKTYSDKEVRRIFGDEQAQGQHIMELLSRVCRLEGNQNNCVWR